MFSFVSTTMVHSPSAYLPSSTLGPVPAFVSTISWSWLYTTGAILLALLALEQSVYRYKKRHLPGAKWTIPIIGRFADSLNPTLDGYKRGWDSGALSAISVFNMYVFMSCPLSLPFHLAPHAQLYRYGLIQRIRPQNSQLASICSTLHCRLWASNPRPRKLVCVPISALL